MAHDIFISYAHEDRDRVRPIVNVLVREGWTVWWDHHLLAGKKYTEEIHSELKQAKAVLVLWSRHSQRSSWVQSEAENAMQRDVLVPIRLTDVEPPFPFGRLQSVDHFGPGEPAGEAHDLLVRSLRHLIGAPATRTDSPSQSVGAPSRSLPNHTPSTPGTKQVRRSAPGPSAKVPASDAPKRSAPPPLAPPKASRRAGYLAAGGIVAGLALVWILRATRRGDVVPQYVLQASGPITVEWDEDRRTGARFPRRWEVVDGTPGHDGWAQKVREPVAGIEMQLIPPGQFFMGSPKDEPGREDDETRHLVDITRPFYLGITEVTEAQVNRFNRQPGGSDLPVDAVPWKDASEFCLRIGCALPTEAQWEYAARAHSEGRWWWGDRPEDGAGKANVHDKTFAVKNDEFDPSFPFHDDHVLTSPERTFEPNPFGLYDMVGNVWEWVRDVHVDYGSDAVSDPCVIAGPGPHILRGGSFSSPLECTRAAYRLKWSGEPVDQMGRWKSQTGFRVAFELPSP